jgi:iron(III) transport system permease protein
LRHLRDTFGRAPGRWGGRLAVTCAWAVLAVALLIPAGTLLLRSFEVYVVETTKGQVLRAVGEVDRVEGRGPTVETFKIQPDPQGDLISLRLPVDQVREIRTEWSLEHYRRVFGDPRTRGLLWHTFLLAAGSVLAALLLGLPLAWWLGRTMLPGRRVLTALCLAPAILPPYFVGMAVARPLGNALQACFGFEGGTLQLVEACLVFGGVLYPLVVLLVGRALAAVPVGPWEAARLLGGRRAALRHVVLPAVLPAVLGASVLVFVLAASDFAVPDLLGFLLPQGSTPVNVFPTEIRLQWEKDGNTGRAVATGAPFLVVTFLLVAISLVWIRRSAVVGGGGGGGPRPRVPLGKRGRALGWALIAVVLLLTVAAPLWGVTRWAYGAGETAAQQPAGAVPQPPTGRLLDFARAFRDTPGLGEDTWRWLRTGLATALLATAVATLLARQALRGGRWARAAVVSLAGAFPLAVPGLVVTISTLLLWVRWDVPFVENGIGRSVLALTARFLPFALLAAWLALREARRGHEEAAAVLGAGPATRAARIWGPLAWRGLLGGALVVLVLALREVDAVILIETRILPLRLYDKIHYSRLADEANIALLYVGILLVPALLAALLLGRRGKRPAGPALPPPPDVRS